MNDTRTPNWLKTPPIQLQGKQKVLATLQIYLEETEEKLESLRQLHSELQARIARIQQDR